jgi:hypothetical protein
MSPRPPGGVPGRLYADYTAAKLREIVEEIRDELATRKTAAARRLREEIDPDYEIDRPHDCCVYVVALDPEVRRDKAFRKKNPSAREDRPCLYVGSTSKGPDARFAQHKAGEQHSRIVRKHGVGLRPEFSAGYQKLTRDEAESAEKALAKLLRREGYGVWQE